MLELAGEFAREQRAAEALTIIDGLPAALSEAQQNEAMNVRATALRELGRVDEAVAIGQAALAMPALRGRARADLLDAMVIAMQRAGRMSVALELATESLEISRAMGAELGVARGLNRLGTFKFELGDVIGAEADLQRAVAQCERLGLVGLQRGGLYNLCCLYSAQSRSAEVLGCAQRIWALQPPMQRSELRVMVHLPSSTAQIALGDLGDAWEHAQAAAEDALAGGQLLAAATVVLTAIELFGLLGARSTTERLLASLSDEALRQMPQISSEMWTARAHFELLTGDVAAAQRTLALIEAPARIESGRIQVRHGIVAAECALARGDAAGALARLPADDAPGMNEEMRLQGLAVRLGAQGLAGAPPAATLHAVREALESPQVHTVSALTLVRALSALRPAAPCAVPADLQARGAALVARLAASLHAHPAQQTAFLRING